MDRRLASLGFASLVSIALLVTGCFVTGCGLRRQGGAPVAASPRPGGAADLMALVPANATVVLHANMNSVRADPARYERLATGLASALGLAAETATVRALLDRTDDAVGVFMPGATGQQEGMLLFSGRFAPADFDAALAIATARHGAQVAAQVGGDGRRIVPLGNATLVQLDTWTWAVATGASLRAHISAVPMNGGRTFGQNLLEFGPRIGLPNGSAQAWANQQQPVGRDMVGLVLAGENPQMIQNFVATVRRHLGL